MGAEDQQLGPLKQSSWRMWYTQDVSDSNRRLLESVT